MVRLNCERPGCVDVFRSSLVADADYEGELEIPALESTDALPDKMIPFSQAVSLGKHTGWVHFYEDDVKFERVWRSPERYLSILEHFGGVIAPDFSLYRDMPLVMQHWNVYRSRAFAHALQSRGQNVIANLRFGDERTFEVACLGVPHEAGFAVGTHGLLRDSTDRKLLAAGLEYAVERLHPKIVVVYGSAPDQIFGEYRKNGVHILQFDSKFAETHRKVD